MIISFDMSNIDTNLYAYLANALRTRQQYSRASKRTIDDVYGNDGNDGKSQSIQLYFL